jgi:hypothetical protein
MWEQAFMESSVVLSDSRRPVDIPDDANTVRLVQVPVFSGRPASRSVACAAVL